MTSLFGDYQRAISYFKRVIAMPFTDFSTFAFRHALNDLGLSYRELNQLDSSDIVFEKLLVHADSTSPQWVGIASGNLGYTAYLRQDFARAVPLLLKDIEVAEQYGELGLAAGAYIPLADIYLSEGKLTLAGDYLKKAKRYIYQTQQLDRLARYYPIASKWQAKMNQPQKAILYLDSALIWQKSVSEKFSALQLMRANQEVVASQNEKTIQGLNEVAERNRLLRNTSLIVLGIILISLLIVYRQQSQRIKAERKLKKAELSQAHIELESAKTLLETYRRKINNNSKIIQSLEDAEDIGEKEKTIEALRATTILTETDWDAFRAQFQKAFPQLLEKLPDSYPNLSPADVRFLLLTKLELSSLEIANALGVSPASLRVTWYRIRKKLDLQKDFPPALFFETLFSWSIKAGFCICNALVTGISPVFFCPQPTLCT